MSHYFDRGTMRQYRQHTAIEAFASDGEMLSDAINGSNAMLAALESKQGPDRFLWRERAGNLNWKPNQQSQTTGMMVHRVSLIQEREAHADSLRVYREPCRCCGSRIDIGGGCKQCAL